MDRFCVVHLQHLGLQWWSPLYCWQLHRTVCRAGCSKAEHAYLQGMLSLNVVRDRVAHFQQLGLPVVVTTASLFVLKALLFPDRRVSHAMH